MISCKTRFIGWMLHDWYSILVYPPQLSDGEGGCWAGHLVKECRSCSKRVSNGIWAASETLEGKSWALVRSASPEEMTTAFTVFESSS